MKEPFYIRPLKLSLAFAQSELARRSDAFYESPDSDDPHLSTEIAQAQHLIDTLQSALNQAQFLYTNKKNRPNPRQGNPR